ncbi:MAG: bifunctional phosphoglucose/phosphomannose isomerase [Anaerolineae bacterium]|jgi:glucose/mannose-6-phosphate isomerase
MKTVDLDDLDLLHEIDEKDMLGHVANLGQQCRDAWEATKGLELSGRHLEADRVMITGMGGSAIGGDLAAAVVEATSPLPITVHRDYELPGYVDDQTVVIASSYSGKTEETLSSFKIAHDRGCPLVAVTTGGRLAELAAEWDVPLVRFNYQSQPRAALGHSLFSLLGVLHALGLGGKLEADLEEAMAVLDQQKAELQPEAAYDQNRAKQLAQDMAGRIPIIVGAGPLAPVARRWKTQFNENAKSWAYFEVLPEMDHNALSGIEFPPEAKDWLYVFFLRFEGLHSRVRLRIDLTHRIFGDQGIATQQVDVPGESVLAQIMAGVQLGDYVSCYAALLNRTDPTAIGAIEGLKKEMAGR